MFLLSAIVLSHNIFLCYSQKYLLGPGVNNLTMLVFTLGTNGAVAVVTSKSSSISNAMLHFIDESSGFVAVFVPLVDCDGSLASDELNFPVGSFAYRFTGTDHFGHVIDIDLGIKAVFTAPPYDLTLVDELEPGKTTTLLFNLANTFSSDFSFSVNDIAEFTTKVTPTVTGTSVRVEVEVTASLSVTPGSTNTFTLTGDNGCTTVTADRNVYIKKVKC